MLNEIDKEVQRSIELHGGFKSLFDGAYILQEEYIELDNEIRAVKNQNKIPNCQKERIKEESIQLAAMCVKLIKYLEG